MLDEQTNVQENQEENQEEIKASPETSQEPSKQAKVSLADIQQSELFRKTQGEKDRAVSQAQNLQNQLNSLQDQLETLQYKQQEALIGETGDPSVAKQILAELKRVKGEVKQKNKELDDAKAELDKYRPAAKLYDATELGKQYDCPPELLLEAENYAEMVGIAKGYAKSQTATPKAEVKKTEPKIPEHIDSGHSTGSGEGRVWKASEIANMSAEERFANRAEIVKAGKENRIDNTK